jgi:hypothetical protein
MNRFRLTVIATLIATLIPFSTVSARGTGGLTWGEQYFDGQFANYNVQASASGAFGYGVTRSGTRVGGFALALHSDAPAAPFDAGFVGSITGQEIRASSFVAAVNLWTGIGAISSSPVSLYPATIALFSEATLEVGISVFPSVTVTAYAGMQAIAPVLVAQRMFDVILYTPTFGIRIGWGN